MTSQRMCAFVVSVSHQRKSVSVVSLSDDFKSEIWCELKAHVLKYPPTVSGQVLYMCHYCKTRVRSGNMPARCVLNGLQTVPIPPELAKLDLLSRQLIQRAKCYQTIVRLGTYTGKVPIYNSLQACKGTMFFLPLPLNKTLETLNQVDQHTLSYQTLSCISLSMVGPPRVMLCGVV